MTSKSIKYLIGEGFRSIWINRMMSLASVCVLMSCLVIIGSAFMVFQNIQTIMARIEEQNVIMVFFEKGVSDDDIAAAGDDFKKMDNVKSVVFVPKEEGWEKEIAQMEEAQQQFFEDASTDKEIPLPDSYKITVKDMSSFAKTVEELKKYPGLDTVRDNSSLAQKLVTVRQGISVVAIAIIVILLAVSMFIISNTIRLTMYSRRLEINIMKSVGATDTFVKIPFVVEGITLGILSGLLSIGIVYAFYELAINMFDDLLAGMGMQAVSFLDNVLILMGVFIVIGVFTGVFGSLVSMQKYLKREGSEISEI